MLEELLVSHGLLASTKYVSAREQLAIFLFVIRRDETDRDIQEEFQHSGETISRHFRNVLKVICSLSDEFIVLPSEDVGVHPRVRDNRRFYPYFANALGAVDGTHIPAHVSKSKSVPYQNRKGFLSQNIMAAASFDHTLFICVGWEGSTGDMKVLRWCIERNEFRVPDGKYSLMDSGYANSDKFIAPYRGGWYHMGTFTEDTPAGRYRDAKDMFNHWHA